MTQHTFNPESWTDEDIEQMTVDFMLELGMTVSERTRKEYAMVCRQVLRALHADSVVRIRSKAKWLQVRSVVKKLIAQRRLPKTVTVRGVTDKWQKHGEHSNAARNVKDKAYTQADFQSLLTCIATLPASDERKRQLTLASKIAFSSGMRLGEVLAMSPDDITVDADTDEVTVWIPRGKGNEARYAYLPKSLANEMRTFTPFTIKHSYVIGVFWKMKAQDGIKGTFHGLRHGFALYLKNLGTPAEEMQMLLGHASIETTMKHYYLKQQYKPDSLKQAGY